MSVHKPETIGVAIEKRTRKSKNIQNNLKILRNEEEDATDKGTGRTAQGLSAALFYLLPKWPPPQKIQFFVSGNLKILILSESTKQKESELL